MIFNPKHSFPATTLKIKWLNLFGRRDLMILQDKNKKKTRPYSCASTQYLTTPSQMCIIKNMRVVFVDFRTLRSSKINQNQVRRSHRSCHYQHLQQWLKASLHWPFLTHFVACCNIDPPLICWCFYSYFSSKYLKTLL